MQLTKHHRNIIDAAELAGNKRANHLHVWMRGCMSYKALQCVAVIKTQHGKDFGSIEVRVRSLVTALA